MSKAIPVAVAIIIVTLSAVVQGVYTNRFTAHTATDELREMAQMLDKLPAKIGSWEGEQVSTDQAIELVAGIVGSVNRVYTSPTGEACTIALVCGNRRNMTTHTPERCFRAGGWTMAASGTISYPIPIENDAQGEVTRSVEFLAADFRRDNVTEGRQFTQVLWAWNADGEWIAPEADPRLPGWMGGLPAHKSWYKLYIMSDKPMVGGAHAKVSDTPAFKFARLLLPTIDETVFKSGASEEEMAPAVADIS